MEGRSLFHDLSGNFECFMLNGGKLIQESGVQDKSENQKAFLVYDSNFADCVIKVRKIKPCLSSKANKFSGHFFTSLWSTGKVRLLCDTARTQLYEIGQVMRNFFCSHVFLGLTI